MFGGLNRPLVAALAGVALAALAAPTAAFADCGGGPSAQHVYSECVQGASGGKKTKPPTTHVQGPPISSQTAHKLKRTGKDYRQLSVFARGRGERRLESPPTAASAPTPSALGSAFDLGSGPLALLAALAGTALLLLGGSGLRLWRARHHG